MKNYIKINETDNVIVALKEIAQGESIPEASVTALETIPAGHKMAVRDIPAGSEIIKYGFRIGHAKEDIRAGAWVHVHNIKTALGGLLEYTYEPAAAAGTAKKPVLTASCARTAAPACATKSGLSRPSDA